MYIRIVKEKDEKVLKGKDESYKLKAHCLGGGELLRQRSNGRKKTVCRRGV